MVDIDGRMSTVLENFTAPSRLAMRPGGWLYVANDSGAVTAVNVTKKPFQLAIVPGPDPQPLRPAPPVVVARKVT
jgi:hypothetical protein